MTSGRWRDIATLTLLLAGVGVAPAFARNRNVLVLDTGVPGRPLATAMIGAFRDTLLGSPSEPVSIYEEALDLERFPGEADVARVRTFLADKYREHPPEVIVAIADPAIRLVLEQRVTPLEGLKAMTIWAAEQYGEQGSKGSLEPGKTADLVILSGNPLKVDKMAIKDIQVLETFKDGQSIYRKQ